MKAGNSGQSGYRLGLLFTRHFHFAVANEAGDQRGTRLSRSAGSAIRTGG
jgi:hypothetical protein